MEKHCSCLPYTVLLSCPESQVAGRWLLLRTNPCFPSPRPRRWADQSRYVLWEDKEKILAWVAPWWWQHRLWVRGEQWRQQNTYAPAGLQLLLKDRDLWRRGSREQFFQNPRQISPDTRSLTLTWTWMTTQTMNSASDGQPRWPSCWSCRFLRPVQFPRQKSIELGGDLRAWHSSHKLTGVEQPYFFFVQTRLRTIPMAAFKAKRQKN